MITSKQRSYLKSLANGIDPVVYIGKGGLTENILKEMDQCLEARELIKLTVLETSPMKARECADEVAKATESDVVQVIGSKFILYKQSKDNKQIVLVK